MREIKFRGKIINTWDKNKNNGDWICGSLIQNKDASFIAEKTDNSFMGYCKECDRTFADMYRVDTNTIGQYTGIDDDFYKEIYEGDILKCKLSNGKYENYLVEWIEENCSFEAWNKNKSNFIDCAIWNNFEIIGNIYESKELLEVE